MIRNTVSILMASALAAGCNITTTSAGSDGGPGANDAGVVNPMGTDAAGASTDAETADAETADAETADTATADAATADVVTGDAAPGGGCAFGEPNDTRETATPIDVNRPYKGMCLSNADGTTDQSDFYVMTAPNDVAGGYVVFTVSNVEVTGTVQVLTTAVADGASMVTVTGNNDGASVTGWFTVSPGAQYRLELKRYPGSGPSFTYDLQLAYTKVTDAYEPNNTRADAKAIALVTPIQASAVAFSANAALSTADGDDWYKLTLAAGAATVKVTNVPADFTCNIHLFDPTNAAIGTPVGGGGAGANCEIDATGITAGAYTLDVRSYLTIDRAGSGTPPPSITTAYTLAVTQ